MNPKIAVIGLGYVGLPLALAFAKKFDGTIGFDINQQKVERLNQKIDDTGEGLESDLKTSTLKITNQLADLKGSNFYVVGVPTPVDINRQPDLQPLLSACESLAEVISKGATIVFESTVYPGVTEEICGPYIEKHSGLKQGRDFKLAYSPERINPGDKEHTLEKIIKVVSGEDQQTLSLVADVYSKVISAGIHKAPSIKVAEAAKVIENTQRDLNIALMNELSIIFDKLGIATRDVLDAARTKWNFLGFTPGLVGGHCIGVDPYYLTTKAEQLGLHPQVILAGRRINDGMGGYVAQRVIKLMVTNGIQPKGARVAVLGLTFKENVSDIRNSRVPDIISELKDFGATVFVHDPLANKHEVEEEYGISLSDWSELQNLNAVILAVAHEKYRKLAVSELLGGAGIIADIKSVLKTADIPKAVTYWSL